MTADLGRELSRLAEVRRLARHAAARAAADELAASETLLAALDQERAEIARRAGAAAPPTDRRWRERVLKRMDGELAPRIETANDDVGRNRSRAEEALRRVAAAERRSEILKSWTRELADAQRRRDERQAETASMELFAALAPTGPRRD